MRQKFTQFEIASRGQGLLDFTHEVRRWLEETGIRDGLLTLFIRHTSASLVIQENADPDVQRDLEAFMARLVPEHDPLYSHILEGPDDMPAHVRATLTQAQLSIPVYDGHLMLGTWQGIYLFEHRHHSHVRKIAAHVIGE
ncbi:MAG: YjbQ family protein [Thiobacillus sp.]|nr:YjbQ family protein [Thiobacillus sp.]